jgi:hypothetical protein
MLLQGGPGLNITLLVFVPAIREQHYRQGLIFVVYSIWSVQQQLSVDCSSRQLHV